MSAFRGTFVGAGGGGSLLNISSLSAIAATTGPVATLSSPLAGTLTFSLLSGANVTVSSAGVVSFTTGLAADATRTFAARVQNAAGDAAERSFTMTGVAAAPTLGTITFGTATLTAAMAPGDVVQTLSGKTAGSTLTIEGDAFTAGRLAANAGGTAVVVGAAGPGAEGSFSGTYRAREVLAGATNTPNVGADQATITVGAASVPDAPLASDARLAVHFPFANGVSGNGRVVGGTWTNLFGDGTTAAAGAIAIKMRHVPGAHQSSARPAIADANLNRIFGVLNGGDGNFKGFALSHLPAGGSVGNNPSWPNGYAWNVGNRTAGANGQVGTTTLYSHGRPYLPSPPLDINNQGVVEAWLILRRTAAGEFQARAIQPGDTALRAGGAESTVTNAAFVGINSMDAVLHVGGHGVVPTTGLQNAADAMDFCNVIQLQGTEGTDAEWLRIANGESPAVVWNPATQLKAWYRLGGPDDLTLTAGFGTTGYGALTITGTGLVKSSRLVATPGTVTAANSLYAQGSGWGVTHALAPSALFENRGAGGGAAGLLAKTGRVFLPVVVGGASTHLQVRVVRDDGAGTVIQDWTRWTSSAVTGAVTLERDGIRPSGGTGHRYDVRREDDTACVAMCRNREDLGLVIAGVGQSQMEIALRGSATAGHTAAGTGDVPLIAAAANFVTFSQSRWRGLNESTNGRWTPAYQYFMANNAVAGRAVNATANWWAENFPGVRLCMVAMAIEGSGTGQWLENENYRTSTDFKYWGDGSDVKSGHITSLMKAHRNRITAFALSWHTNDFGSAASATMVNRLNEFFGGTEASNAQAPNGSAWTVPFASRRDMVKEGLSWNAHVILLPGSRSPAVYSNAQMNNWVTFKKQQRDWALSGTLRIGPHTTWLGEFQAAPEMDGVLSPHSSDSTIRGNTNFVLPIGWSVAFSAGLWVLPNKPKVSGATLAGNLITVSFTLPAGWTLRAATDGTAPAEFFVAQGDDTTWVVASTLGTLAISGSTVTLTKTSGNWAVGTRIAYNRGIPVAGNVSLSADAAVLAGLLYAIPDAGAAVKPTWAAANALLPNGLAVEPDYVPWVAA